MVRPSKKANIIIFRISVSDCCNGKVFRDELTCIPFVRINCFLRCELVSRQTPRLKPIKSIKIIFRISVSDCYNGKVFRDELTCITFVRINCFLRCELVSRQTPRLKLIKSIICRYNLTNNEGNSVEVLLEIHS